MERHGMARSGNARLGEARQGVARNGMARSGLARHGKVFCFFRKKTKFLTQKCGIIHIKPKLQKKGGF